MQRRRRMVPRQRILLLTRETDKRLTSATNDTFWSNPEHTHFNYVTSRIAPLVNLSRIMQEHFLFCEIAKRAYNGWVRSGRRDFAPVFTAFRDFALPHCRSKRSSVGTYIAVRVCIIPCDVATRKLWWYITAVDLALFISFFAVD